MIFRLLDLWLGFSSWREEAPEMFDGAKALESIDLAILETAPMFMGFRLQRPAVSAIERGETWAAAGLQAGGER